MASAAFAELRARPARRRHSGHRVALLGLGATGSTARWPACRWAADSRSTSASRTSIGFAWIGAFSSAPNTKAPAELVPDPAAVSAQLKLFYLSCGNKDGLFGISQGVHGYLKERNVPHVWNVDGHGHDPTHWRNNLYHFAQRIFR